LITIWNLLKNEWVLGMFACTYSIRSNDSKSKFSTKLENAVNLFTRITVNLFELKHESP